MTQTETSYDKVAYPAGIFPQTVHAKLAVLATMHGLEPAPPRTARVLEVGGGSGMNLIAMAAAYPEARFAGFDLAASAVEVGQALIAAAGLTNVELYTGDICEEALRLEPGGWDYIIAHGVYAWVPEPVREALLALYGRALSPRGLGFVSYNAMPGGHIRMIMRERLLDALEGIDDIGERMAATRAVLREIAEEDAVKPDDPMVSTLHGAIRYQARSMLARPPEVLFHDELGEVFAPQRLSDVAAAGARHGLRLLTDAGRNMALEGFMPAGFPEVDDEEGTLLRILQQSDHEEVRFFRQSVFVRAEAQPERRMSEAVTARIADLFVLCNVTRNEDGTFQHGDDSFTVPNAELEACLLAASAVYPAAVRAGDYLSQHMARGGLLRLFAEGYLELRHDPPPYVTELSERPMSSPLVRGNIALDSPQILGLNHTIIAVAQPELRKLLMLADGSRTVAELENADSGFPPGEVVDVLRGAIARGLMAG